MYTDRMKPLKLTLAIALLLCALASAVSAAPRQAFLKVNQFYILYTNPIVPQYTKNGDFLVGLQSAALILNAKAFTNAQATVTTVVKGTHKIQITAGSSMALVDGKPVHMAAPAMLKQPSGQIVVPLSALIRALHLQSRWDDRRRVLVLIGKNLMNNIPADSLGNIAIEVPSKNTALVPFSADFGGPHNAARHRLQFKAQNASSRILKKGSAYINLVNASELPTYLNHWEGPYQVNYVIGGVPWPPDLATYSPALKPGATWSQDIEISGPASPKTIYIAVWLAVGRVSGP